MKFIKKTLLGLLVLFLTGLIIIFTISVDLKKVIVNGVIMEVVKYQISTINYKEGNNEKETVLDYTTDNEQINEILRSKEVQDLVTKYLDLTIESMNDDDSLNEIDIEKDMMQYIRDNKSVLEEKIGMEITEEMIQKTEEEMQEQEVSKNLKEAIKETRNNLTEKQKKTLKGYSFLTSLKLKIILMLLMIIDCTFIFLLQKEDYKWVYVIANSIFSAGVGILLMSIIAKIIISKMANIQILKLSILITHGITEIVIGLIIMISYKIIRKIINKKKEGPVNEISEFSESTEY